MPPRKNKKDLRPDLLKKLDIATSTLSDKLRPYKGAHGLSPEQALWVVAAKSGMHLADYLSAGELEVAQQKLNMVNNSASITQVSASHRPKAKRSRKLANEVRFSLPSGKIYMDPETSKTVAKQAKDMSQHYAVLYLLENSIRTLFREVMIDEYGEDWWGQSFKRGAANGVKNNIDSRMASREERRRWHQKASDCPLDYTSLEQLKILMMSKSELLFPKKLGIEKEKFDVWMDDLISIRNVLCHMNPLDRTSINDLSVKYDRWIELCRAYKR